MAIRLKCSQCRKQMSVDDAFAGGVCRCPYCKATVMVPGSREDGARGARPAEPGAQPLGVEQPSQAQHHAPIPVATPVRSQGMLGIVLAVLVVAMLGVGIWLLITYKSADSVPDNSQPNAHNDWHNTSAPSAVANPFVAADSPVVAGDVQVSAPVAYVIDSGPSMASVFDLAALMTRVSVRSLKDGQFSLIVAGEKEDATLGSPQPGGDTGADAVNNFTRVRRAGSGRPDLARAFAAARAAAPKTIVLFYGNKNVSDLLPAAQQVQQAGMKLVVLCLDPGEDAVASGNKLAQAAGGVFRSYRPSELRMMVDEAPSD
jgi:DNA-directed RNA polymerase subunit RPC12/RpoP